MTTRHKRGNIAHITKAGARNAADADEAAERDSWQTPWPIVYALCEYAYADFQGFGLDVAASKANAKAPVWITAAIDGLTVPWVLRVNPKRSAWHDRIWCNPPWSSITQWLDRMHDEDHTGVVLGPLSDTTIRWSVKHPTIAWRIVGDARLAFETVHGVRKGGAGQATLAWFFRPTRYLEHGGGVISDAELADSAQRIQTLRGLPLFG